MVKGSYAVTITGLDRVEQKTFQVRARRVLAACTACHRGKTSPPQVINQMEFLRTNFLW